MYRDEAAEALAEAEFFEICDDEQRRMLAFASDRRRFRADDIIYRSSDTPQGAIVLIGGALKVSPDTGKPFAVTRRGSVLSAMALILAKPRPLTISAVVDSELLIVPRHAFIKLAQQSPDLAARAADRVREELVGYLDALEPLGKRMKRE